VKSSTRNVDFHLFTGNCGRIVYVDMPTKSITGDVTWDTSCLSYGASVDDVGNGWLRVRVAMRKHPTDTTMWFVIKLNDSYWGNIYAGDTSKGMYLWGAQLEQPDQTVGSQVWTGTNYIPTTTAAVSRASEFLTSTGGLGSWYSSNGTWFIDYEHSPLKEDGPFHATILNVLNSSSDSYRWVVRPGGYASLILKESGSDTNTHQYRDWIEGNITGVSNYKSAFTVSSGDMAVRLNALTTAATTPGASIPFTPNQLSIGNAEATSEWESFTGWIKEIRFYKGRITDSDMNTLTSPTAVGLTDYFEDNSFGTKWVLNSTVNYDNNTYNNPNNNVISEANGQIKVVVSPSSSHYEGLVTSDTYDLRGKWVQVEFVQAGKNTPSTSCSLEAGLWVLPTAANPIYISTMQLLSGWTVLGYGFHDGTDWDTVNDSNYDSNPSNYRFIRVRHDNSANVIYQETSANGYTWTIRRAFTPLYSLAAVRLEIGAGTWCSVTSNTPAFFDNFKTNAPKN
jgi:hypothetical protein